MKNLIVIAAIFTFVCLAGCGNVDRGYLNASLAQKSAAGSAAQSQTSTSTSGTTSGVSNLQFSNCVNLIAYTGTDSWRLDQLQGISACPSTNSPGTLQFKPTTRLAVGTSMCFIPYDSSGSPGQSVCAAINGTQNVNVGMNNFTYIAVMFQDDLSLFQAWDGMSDTNPDYAWAQVR